MTNALEDRHSVSTESSMSYENEQTSKRAARSQKDIMTEATRKYGDRWRSELERINKQRAEHGIFPKEFAISQTESEVERYRGQIADVIFSRYTENTRPGNGDPHVIIVLLGGGGAAGKTTFCLDLMEDLRKKGVRNIVRLELDNYFYPLDHIGDRASDGKYDNPLNSSIERVRRNLVALRQHKNTVIPVHDRKNHESRLQSFLQQDDLDQFINANVIIVEGLYSLAPELYDLGDLRIYIDASPLDRAKGRVWRDIIVRKRDERHVIEMLMGREIYHQTFVEPTQIVADYIFRRPATGGHLRVVYEDEIEESFRNACLGWLFCTDDFKDPIRFALKLQNCQDSASKHLRECCSDVSKYLADLFSKDIDDHIARLACSDVAIETLKMELAIALNDVVRRGLLYDEQRFCDVDLTVEIKDLLAHALQDDEVVKLNRLLMEYMYPDEIHKSTLHLTQTDEDRLFSKYEDLQRQDTERRAKRTEF